MNKLVASYYVQIYHVLRLGFVLYYLTIQASTYYILKIKLAHS